jgi:predicted GIY-YIG superfamily endonuclease
MSGGTWRLVVGEVPFSTQERVNALKDEQALKEWIRRAALHAEMDPFWNDANTRVTDV